MRRIFLWLSLILVPLPVLADLAITDDAGREVRLEAPARRVILTDGMGFLAMLLLDEAPQTRLAGWNRGRLDQGVLSLLEAGLPGLAEVPDIGEPEAGASLEALIALEPDLVILDPYYNRSPAMLRVLDLAAIPVAVLALTPDIRAEEPHAGLIRLGILLGAEERARDYAAFADAKLARIESRVSGLSEADRPSVLLEAHAGMGTCCISTGAGKGIGDFVAFAGGTSIGAAVIPGMSGQLSAEYILESSPEIYIGTGGGYLAAQNGLVLGPGVAPALAQEGLIRVIARRGIEGTPAAETGRAFGIWHALSVSAMNVVAVEAMAGWIQPGLFGEEAADATLAEINSRFAAMPLTGALWVAARDAP